MSARLSPHSGKSALVDIASPARRHRRLRATTGTPSLDLRELFHFRDLLLTLAIRDIKLRYRQTALGVLWVVLQPLIAAGIFTFVFGHIANLKAPGGIPYFAFAFAGQIAWMAFATTLTKTSSSLVGNAALVSKIYFPRLVLPISTLLTTVVDFAVGFVTMLLLFGVYRIPITGGIVLAPLFILLISLMSLGIGLFAAALMVRYRDVGFVLPVVVQFLLYASPVAWSMSEVAARYGARSTGIYLTLNPLAALLEAFRWSLFGKGNVPWGFVAYAAILAFALLWLGAIVFRTQERRFADVI